MFNILNVTMVIIGPRPILDWEFESYKEKADLSVAMRLLQDCLVQWASRPKVLISSYMSPHSKMVKSSLAQRL